MYSTKQVRHFLTPMLKQLPEPLPNSRKITKLRMAAAVPAGATIGITIATIGDIAIGTNTGTIAKPIK